MASKIKLNEVVLTSPNGLVEKSISMGDDGIVKVNGVQVADIEIGSFTPTLIGLTTAGTGNVYIAQYGSYTRVGKLVTCFGRVGISAKGNATGGILIAGLPYSAQQNVGRPKVNLAQANYITGHTIDTLHGSYIANVNGSVAVALADNTGNLIDFTSATSNTLLDFSITYAIN